MHLPLQVLYKCSEANGGHNLSLIRLFLNTRYIQCIHQKLYHLTPVEYEDFVSIVLSARTAFQLTPEGNTQFKEWLASLRRYDDLLHYLPNY